MKPTKIMSAISAFLHISVLFIAVDVKSVLLLAIGAIMLVTTQVAFVLIEQKNNEIDQLWKRIRESN